MKKRKGLRLGRVRYYPSKDFPANNPTLVNTPIPGSPTTTNYFNPALPGYHRIDDVVTVGYKELIAEGRIICNRLKDEEIYYDGSLGTQHGDCYLNSGGTVLTSTYDLTGYRASLSVCRGIASTHGVHPAYDNEKLERLKQATIDSAYADAYEGYAQMIVELAELGKTLQMFGSPLSALGPIIQKNLVKGNKSKKFRDLTKRDSGKIYRVEKPSAGAYGEAASNLWLQWRYGVRPLMATIMDLMTAYEKKLQKPIRYTGRGKDSYHYTGNDTTTYQDTTAGYGISRPYVYKYSYDRMGTVRAGAIVQGSITPAQALGLTLDNLPSALYELVPYSFVLDWIFNVGSWLRARVPAPHIEVVGSWCTVSDYLAESYSLTYTPGTYTGTNGRKIVVSSTPSLMYRHSRTKERTPGVKPGILPTFVGDTLLENINHLIDATALSYQAFARKRQVKSRR